VDRHIQRLDEDLAKIEAELKAQRSADEKSKGLKSMWKSSFFSCVTILTSAIIKSSPCVIGKADSESPRRKKKR